MAHLYTLNPMRRYSAGFLLMTFPLFAQHPFSHAELGFALTVPAGFLGEGEDIMRSVNPPLACWIKPSAGDQGWIRLCVERQSELPAGGERMTFTWKGHDLAGKVVRAQTAREEAVMVAALVPLRKATIRVVAWAPDRASAQATVVGTLASLQGEGGWQSSTERAARAGDTVGRIVVIIFALGAGMWIMQRRLRQKPGTGN